jgi:translocation and assembly module TamB
VRRLWKFLAWVGIAIGVVVVLLALFIGIVVPSSWFQNFVRGKIVSAAENATGGRVDLQSFHFDAGNLTATVRGFVIHGNEPAGSAPLFDAPVIVLRLKLFASRTVDLEYLGAERPSANILIYADGRTNLPTPKSKSNGNAVDTVVDLAIRQIEIRDGTIHFGDRTVPLNLTGRNLKIGLAFDAAASRYKGQLSMAPIVIASNSAPIEGQLTVPVELATNSVKISNAKLQTKGSELNVNAELWNLASPDASADVMGRVSLAEIERSFAVPLNLDRNASVLQTTASIQYTGGDLQIRHAQMSLGKSQITASGDLKAGAGFHASLDLPEISTLLALAEKPSGVVTVDGTAKLPFQVSGTVATSAVSFTASGTSFKNVSLDSRFLADANRIELQGARVRALGGEIAGDVAIENESSLRATVDLRGFDLQHLASEFAKENLKFAGSISGRIEASANLKQDVGKTLDARAEIAIAPKSSGTPVSGELAINYRGDRELVSFGKSQIRLPHSTMTLSGVAGEDAELSITSRNLSDFASLPVNLRSGSASVIVYERGPLANPQISGSLQMRNFGVQNSQFADLSAQFMASPARVSIQDGVLRGNNVNADFTGFVGLDHWKPSSKSSVAANATVQNGQLADILALAGESDLHGTGLVNAALHVTGTVSAPVGRADLSITKGSIEEKPFDRIQADAEFNGQQAELKTFQIDALSGRIDGHGSYSEGRIQGSLSTTELSLSTFGVDGTARANADVLANFTNGQFSLKAVNASLNAKTKQYGDVNAQASTYGNVVNTRIESNAGGSVLRATAETRLSADYPTTGQLSVSHMDLSKVVPAARANELSGELSGEAKFSGTVKNPNVDASLRLLRAKVYGEPVNSVNAAGTYSAQLLELRSLSVSAPAGRLEAHGSYSHDASDLRRGHGEIFLSTPGLDLKRIAVIQKRQPGLTGTLRINGDVAVNVGEHILPVRADVTGSLASVALDGKTLGNLTFTSQTSGSAVNMRIDSDLANSSVHGNLKIALAGDYPATGELSFQNLTLASLRPFISSLPQDLDGAFDGQTNGSVPLMNPEKAQGSVQITKLDITAQNQLSVHNQGPVVLSVENSTVRVDHAEITGPSTDIAISGSAGFKKNAPLNISTNAKIDMQVVKIFHPNAYTAGAIDAVATVRGTLAQPAMNGQVQVKGVSLQLGSWPTGIANANGVIQLNGTDARIVSLTAESGGGKITATGFAAYTGSEITLDLKANARGVRARYSGASISANATVSLTGTSRRSVLAGTVTITRVGYSQQSDIGSILTASSTPPQVPSAPTGITAGMRLNVRIQTAPDVIFQTSMAEQLSANADMTLEGTAASPGMVGRVNVTGGTLIFFGNKYTVNRGSISFYNPLSIDPVLDIDLETYAQGVQVDIGVSGPIEDLKLTYRSDPPLRFEDIVALLAAGKTPPDPTIAVNQPASPDQTATQMGESALLGAAVANPVASRLARVFGVSQLSIAPTFVTGSALPQTRVTVQQQVNSSVTFTYSQDVSQPNSQLIRIEVELTPRFSAVATRDENGILGVDFYYKRQFK